MSKMKNLADAFYDELQDVFSAEKQLTKALPKMVKKASCEKLTKVFEDHLVQTKSHVERVEQAFAETGKAAKAKKCEAMAGLIKEAESMMGEEADPDVMDAILIALAQKARALRNCDLWNTLYMGRKPRIQECEKAAWRKPG